MRNNENTLGVVSPRQNVTEGRLIDSAKRGEEDALERLFYLHKDRVFSICMRMTGDFYEAEDLSQETFVLAFRNIGGFRGQSSFSTWLYRVAVNVVISSLRKKRNRQEFPIDGDCEERPLTPAVRVAHDDLTLERLKLERSIAALPQGYRTVLVLHDVEGYNHEEIAQYLGSAVGTCKSQLHKARRKLRELLNEG